MWLPSAGPLHNTMTSSVFDSPMTISSGDVIPHTSDYHSTKMGDQLRANMNFSLRGQAEAPHAMDSYGQEAGDAGTVAVQTVDSNHEDSDLDMKVLLQDKQSIATRKVVTSTYRMCRHERGSAVDHDEEEITSPEAVVNVRPPYQQKRTLKGQSAEEDYENKRFQEKDIRKQIETLTSNTVDPRVSPVCVDRYQVTTSRGQYREGVEFKILGDLGSGCFGKVFEVEDKATGRKHAMKSVKMVPSSRNEALCMFDLNMSESFPRLYLVGRYGSNMELHMEKISGVTLHEVIMRRTDEMWRGSEGLLCRFSWTILFLLLQAFQQMHSKMWSHNDNLRMNVMLTKCMKLKVLDFGEAKQGYKFGQKKDISHAIDLFCSMYLNAQISRGYMEEHIKKSDMTMSKELIQLDNLCRSEVDIDVVMQFIKKIGFPCTNEELKQAQEELFPDLFQNQCDIDVQEGEEAGGTGLPAPDLGTGDANAVVMDDVMYQNLEERNIEGLLDN